MSEITEFNEKQFNNAYPDGINHHYWTKARNKIIYQVLKNNGLQNERVIEVGCGRGGVVAYLHSKGVAIKGIELAPCQPFEESKDLIITGKDALDLPHDERIQFKVLMMVDVIEHIEIPENFIKNLLDAYPNINTILITVPARKEIWSNYDEYYNHFIRYDFDSLNTVMKKAGCEIVWKSYVFHLLYFPARLLSILSKKRAIFITPPKTFFSKLINNILAKYFFAEFQWGNKNWIGSSIISLSKPHRSKQ